MLRDGLVQLGHSLASLHPDPVPAWGGSTPAPQGAVLKEQGISDGHREQGAGSWAAELEPHAPPASGVSGSSCTSPVSCLPPQLLMTPGTLSWDHWGIK